MSRRCIGGDVERSKEAAPDAPDGTPVGALEAKQQKPPSPRKCRDFIRKETANAMPKIVNAFVEKARDGSVPHFNALAKVGGFDQRLGAADVPKRRRRSLARQLLDEVEKYEARQAAESAATQAAPETGTPSTDNLSPQERS